MGYGAHRINDRDDRREGPRRLSVRRASPLDRYGQTLHIRSREHKIVCRPRLIATRENRLLVYFANDLRPPRREEVDAVFRGSHRPHWLIVDDIIEDGSGGAVARLLFAEERRMGPRRLARQGRRRIEVAALNCRYTLIEPA